MLQRILAATDFSAPGRRAVARAALLARQLDVELVVLHVLPERSLFDRLFHRHEVDYSTVAAGAERAVQADVDDVRSRLGISARPMVLDGVAHRVIATAGPALKADLIVVGARGEGAPGGSLHALGGTSLELLNRASMPLLLVRQPVEGQYYKVLAAVDATASSRAVLAWALQLGAQGAVCEAVHALNIPFTERLQAQGVPEETLDAYVSEERERWERELAEIAAQLGATDRITSVVARGHPATVVMREIYERQPDLVVAGKRRPGAAEADRHGFGSVSLRVAYDSPSDVLIIP